MMFRTDATKTDGAHIITNQRYKYGIVNERNNLIGMFANVKKEYDEPNNGVHVVELKHYYADMALISVIGNKRLGRQKRIENSGAVKRRNGNEIE